MSSPKSVAVIVDGGFVEKELVDFRALTSSNRIEAHHIRALAESTIEDNEELFRIYYYHCPPYMGKEKNPVTGKEDDFEKSSSTKYHSRLLNSIRLSPRFAYRKGVLKFRGYRVAGERVTDPAKPASELDWRPDFEQKQVDIKIGLDIAWLASKHIVDIIAVLSGDTDFVPAMKFARREGIQIRLVTFKHWKHGGHNNLVEHSDYVKCIDLENLIMEHGKEDAAE